MIMILIKEIKEMKEKNNKENEKIKELKKSNEEKERKINILESKYDELKEIVYELDDNIKDKYRDEINLIYYTEKEDNYNMFGENFVENNKDKIELNINGEKTNLMGVYKLRKGENNMKTKTKNKIVDSQHMFFGCSKLKKINELKYLNIKCCNNFEYMFSGCSSLREIKGLEKRNASNGNNFGSKFGFHY